MYNELVAIRELFALYRRECGYGLLACIVAVLRHWQLRHPFREVVTSGLLCGITAFAIDDVLGLFGLSGASSYLASVMVGYVGVETVLGAIPLRGALTRKKDKDDV